jgi:hypothetical protein
MPPRQGGSAIAGGPCTRLQSRLSVFLETTSVTVDEFRPLVLAFAAALQAPMAYCGALPCPDTPHTLPTDDLIGINSHELLDFSHAVHHLGQVAALRKDWSAKARTRWHTQQRRLLLRGEMEQVIAAVQGLCRGRHSKAIRT